MTDRFLPLKRAAGRRLRRIAVRLDPPTDPYGEWDQARQQLVIKVPTGGRGAMSLARIDITPGMLADERTRRNR